MLANILFLAIIVSGSCYCSAKYNKKFEEVLPITCMSIIMTTFIGGCAGSLKIGVYVAVAVAVILYVVTFRLLISDKRSLIIFVKNFFTPGFCFFIAGFIILSVCMQGQLAIKYDEFTHWADIVKVMTNLDDFGTNPMSYSAFKSYPPAMALFQYVLQKINIMIHPETIFSEWHIFLAYQLLFIAVFMPFFKGIKYKEIVKLGLLATIVILMPLIFYQDIFCSVYIDAFLAVIAGTGVSIILLYKKEEKDIMKL